jgi:hypothetical protein
VHGSHAGASDGDTVADVDLELGHIARANLEPHACIGCQLLDVDDVANTANNPRKHQ